MTFMDLPIGETFIFIQKDLPLASYIVYEKIENNGMKSLFDDRIHVCPYMDEQVLKVVVK